MKYWLAMFLIASTLLSNVILLSLERQTQPHFMSSCKDTSLSESIMSAFCKRNDGSWVQSKVNLNFCIGNINGVMVWMKDRAYNNSSMNCRLNASIIYCNSRRLDGTWYNNTFDLNYGISNIDGVLNCNNNPSVTTTPIPPASEKKHKIGDTIFQGQRLLSKNKKYFLEMQLDGNLVLYSRKGLNGKTKDNAIWNSGTARKGKGPFKAVMQNDGNFVVYDSTGAAIWNSNTSKKGKGPFRVIIQDDGNFVIYDNDKKSPWATNTVGKVRKKI
jgi:hypothetical protein